jgi:hypothetical protein
MELLIPGLILVALMVYASTRIKRMAAEAFEAETIETDEYTINKPEGFLTVINGDPKYAFESYSKEYGGAGAEEIRQGTAKLHIRDRIGHDDAIKELLGPDAVKLSDESEIVGGIKYRIIETKRSEKGVELRIQYKTAERSGMVYIFETARLSETTPEFARKIEAMLNSFSCISRAKE